MLPTLVVLAGLGPGSFTEIALTVGAGRDASLLKMPGATPTIGASGEASASLAFYWPRVTDDATPIALQPYLQRASHVRLTLANRLRDLDGTHRGTVGLAVESPLFFRWLWASGSLEIAYAPGYDLRASSGLGLRLGDLLLTVGGTRSAQAPRGFVDLRVVAVEHILVETGASAGADGIDAFLRGTYFTSRHLGLIGGGHGGGEFTTGRTRFGGHIGLSCWASPALGVTGRYGATWSADDAGGLVEQSLLVTVAARAP